jgi:hypothetical protein
MRVLRPQGISKRSASFRLIRRTAAWRQYRLICSMDGQLFRTTEGEYVADLAGVLKELEKERGRLHQVIQVIGSLVGRRPAGIQAKPKRPKRTFSAAARKKISLAQKARWAKTKRTS